VTVAVCSHCGAAIGPGALFCMKCGSDVSGQRPGMSTRVGGPRVDQASVTTTRISRAGLLAQLRDATLGDYEVLAELGHGGMANVYLAHDLHLDRKVAIKVLNPRVAQGEGMVERFRLEARTAAGLSHPHIIPIYAVRETDQLVFFVMKFVVGRPLDDILRKSGPLTVPTVRTILAKVADALAYAHRNGVVHRDIKPANIMIDAEGMPIVTDFGIAKVADRRGLTLTGTALGTPTYMSPEQCNADAITGASDQYSLGVVAFEMLVGRPLYEGDSVVTIMFKHVHEPPPPPEAFGPSVPPELAAAVIRMLQKAPEQRWPSLGDALPALRAEAGHEDTARTQMIELAKGGTHAELLARISTPRSPILVKGRGARAAASPATTAPAAPAPARSRAVWIAAAVLVLAGAGTLAVLQPWRNRAADPQGASVASPPPPAAVDSSVVPPPAAAAPTPSVETPPPAAESARGPAPAAAAPAVQLVRILDAPPSLPEGQVVSLRATVLDQQGRTMARAVRWSSSDPRVAVLRSDGQLSAVAPGRVTITAEANGHRADMQITVMPVVASVTVSPATGQLAPGESLDLVATALGRDGRTLADQTVVWRSSNERVAVVSSVGRATAVGVGATVVTAVAGGQVGTAQIAVTAPAAAPPAAQAPPPVVEEDPRQAITAVVQAYARALESKNLAQAKALYPAMSPASERRTRDALDAMEDLRVRLAPSQITVNGNTAQAVVTGEWVYRGGRLDVNNRYALERRANGWVIVHIE